MRRTYTLVVVAAFAGCAGESTAPMGPAGSRETAAPVSSGATAGVAVPGHQTCGEATGHAAEGSCAEHAGQPVRYPETTTVTGADGIRRTLAGERLAGAPLVSVADLLARPDAYAGKTVRLVGNVSAMCTHRRAWFAVQDADRSGRYVRVLTTPVFLVPENAIGTRASAEGVVEVKGLAPGEAEHHAEAHRLEPQTRAVVVRAIGAEFL